MNKHNVEYLLIGGYSVGYYGYPRFTMDMDIWITTSPSNSEKIVNVIQEFGFDTPELSSALFQKPNCIIRMGMKPNLIEIISSISGVEFDECFQRRIVAKIDDIEVNIISLSDLKKNKSATGRDKDKIDLEHL
ncbi:MAG: nucleotidyltransferase [Ignavibacteriales bacterium]|nr:nucleotidyltransferase [Ignavibacteriales bacterium]